MGFGTAILAFKEKGPRGKAPSRVLFKPITEKRHRRPTDMEIDAASLMMKETSSVNTIEIKKITDIQHWTGCKEMRSCGAGEGALAGPPNFSLPAPRAQCCRTTALPPASLTALETAIGTGYDGGVRAPATRGPGRMPMPGRTGEATGSHLAGRNTTCRRHCSDGHRHMNETHSLTAQPEPWKLNNKFKG